MSSAQLAFGFSTPPNLDQVFREAHRQLKPRTAVPPIHAEFFPFAGLNHTARLNNGKLRIRVSDIFKDAPSDVLGSLATILLAKLYRKSVDDALHRIYRVYILKTDVQERARAARGERGRPPRHTNALGRYVDLDASYERINRLYFDEGMKRPRLSWSKKRSRYILGRYDALHHTIFVSRVFDSPDVPDYVIDYIMFHEMLHVKHRSRVQDARCLVHTSEFREDERRFSHYKPAKQWLKSL
jgi:predicted metal-dependent hydrolase